MDRKGFILRSQPDLISHPTTTMIQQETTREMDATKTVTTPDSRYHGYAAPMDDGRLVTDYRQACVGRAPPGTQYAVKQWTVHNTDEIIRLSRKRQIESTGHVFGMATTELPPYEIQECNTEKCSIETTRLEDGIGLERKETVPKLFGTFIDRPNSINSSRNTTSTNLNTEIGFGRNTANRWRNLYQ